MITSGGVITKEIYDSLSNTHILKIEFIKNSISKWRAKVSIDDVVQQAQGLLTFDSSGELQKEEGLDNVLWSTDYGLHQLKISFKESTQYDSPFSIFFINQNGYPLGALTTFFVDLDGHIQLIYDNGKIKTLKQSIAVALFANPEFLAFTSNHLYQSTEKSGKPRIHLKNSEHAVLDRYLEENSCLNS